MRRLAFVAVSLGLAGCQTMGLSGSDAGEPVATVPAAPAAPAPAVNVAPAANSNGIVGMSDDALRAAWGDPSLKRTETGAEMWQYGGHGNCTLLVYFYRNSSNVMAVTRAEALPGGNDEAAVASCAKAAGKPPLKPIS